MAWLKASGAGIYGGAQARNQQERTKLRAEKRERHTAKLRCNVVCVVMNSAIVRWSLFLVSDTVHSSASD